MLKELLKQALLKGYSQKPGAPIFLQLSGGCDSTALLICMNELKDKFPFKCVTYTFNQKKSFFKRIAELKEKYNFTLYEYNVTEKDVVNNVQFLKERGYEGKVLLDCLSGHLPIIKALENSIVVNGSYADALYGSYFYHFKPNMTPQAFNAKRRMLLDKPDSDGVESLRKLLIVNNNLLLTPFGDEAVVNYFFTKTLEECGGIKKSLFHQEFKSDLAGLKCKIRRTAQQIESGIRDFRSQEVECLTKT